MAHLVAEGFDLAVAAVHQVRILWALLVGIDLDVQRDALDPLLVAEVSAEAMHGDIYLCDKCL